MPALEHRERERPARQRLQVRVRQQPPDQRVLQAEFGGIPVRLRERADRVEHGLQRLRDQRPGQVTTPAGEAHPGRKHVGHRVLLGERQHHLARQPAEQEFLHLGGAHPQRAAKVLVASVVDDPVRAMGGGAAVRQVFGLVGSEELRGEHRPPVLAPHLPPRPGDTGQGTAPVRRKRPDPGPDERVIGGKRFGHAGRLRRRVGHPQRGLQHPAGLRGVDLSERMPPFGAALRGDLAAVVEQLAHARGDPAIPDHAAVVVVDHGDQRVRLLPGVGENADDLVLIAELVRVDVALGRCHLAQMRCPGRARHAGVHQCDRGPLGLGGLPGRAQAGDPGQQRERRRAALPRRVVHQALADELFHAGSAHATLTPPGAEQLADHELGVQRAADRQQFPSRAEHLGEQRVRRLDSAAGGRSWTPAAAAGGLATSALRAHPDSLSDLDMRTLCYDAMPGVAIHDRAIACH